MTLLIAFLSMFLVSPDFISVETNDSVLGDWDYVVEAPDMTYKGIMSLEKEDGELAGALKSDGAEFEMTDIELDGSELSFSINVQGFPCDVTGTFEGDSFKGEVSVEGMVLIISAKRAAE